MTFRAHRSGTAIHFEGLLDDEALAFLKAQPPATRVVLHQGTEVSLECLERLRTLDLEIVAESPFLSRWLKQSP